MQTNHPWVRVVALMLAVASCSGEEPGAPSSDQASTPASGPCALFTQAEIEAILGARVAPGSVTEGMGICHWDGSSTDSAVYAQIQILNDPSYWVKQSLAEGYEELSGIGNEAFLVPELGGWAAQALTETSVVAVALNGGQADRERTIGFLRSVLERM